MKAQELFDIMVGHVRNQGVPSVDERSGKCKYRQRDEATGEMRKCAVGFLIPDGRYEDTLEGSGSLAHNVLDAIPLKYRDSKLKRDLMNIIQAAHDDASHEADFLSEFETRAYITARDLGLDYTPPS